ncbi:MAG: hypothetical protein QOG52_183, partial [Frankiaceae bacterium]|nr:hypothetical protein [Frankiaceae bacterium]
HRQYNARWLPVWPRARQAQLPRRGGQNPGGRCRGGRIAAAPALAVLVVDVRPVHGAATDPQHNAGPGCRDRLPRDGNPFGRTGNVHGGRSPNGRRRSRRRGQMRWRGACRLRTGDGLSGVRLSAARQREDSADNGRPCSDASDGGVPSSGRGWTVTAPRRFRACHARSTARAGRVRGHPSKTSATTKGAGPSGPAPFFVVAELARW